MRSAPLHCMYYKGCTLGLMYLAFITLNEAVRMLGYSLRVGLLNKLVSPKSDTACMYFVALGHRTTGQFHWPPGSHWGQNLLEDVPL